MDSSALLAIVLGEPEAERFALVVAATPSKISAANWLEATMNVDAKGAGLAADFDALMARARIQVIPVTPEMAAAARTANQRFGRQSGSKARLNFGDCFAYALAHTTQEPLLFKGDDFTHTDIAQAAY